MLTVFGALFRGALQDKVSLGWAIVSPLLLLVGLSIAFGSPAYRLNVLIGVLAISIVFFAFNGTPFEVLRQRNIGVFKLLRATSFRISTFLGALTVARGLVTALCVLVVVGIGALFVGGGLTLPRLLAATPVLLLGILCFTFLGVLVGNIANQEVQAASLNNMVTLPMFFLSDAFYNLDRAPSWLQAVSNVLPFQNFLTLLHAALTGTPLDSAYPLVMVLAYTLVFLVLATLTFRWDPYAPVRLRVRQGS